MSDLLTGSSRTEASAFSQESLRAILGWLGTPPPPNAADQLAPLQSHLDALRTSQVTPAQRTTVLDSLYSRGISVVLALYPELIISSLPIPRKTRQITRGLQDLLATLAEDLLTTQHAEADIASQSPSPIDDLVLWRKLYVLSLHLLISNLAAAPAGVGIWRQLHQTFSFAKKAGVSGNIPKGTTTSLKDIYYTAVLLGCAQPASFSSYEVECVAVYLKLFADQIDSKTESRLNSRSAFWIDPDRDAPAVACARKSAPPDTPVHYFSCNRLARLLKEQLTALESGIAPQQIGLPAFASTPNGQGILRRLMTHWGDPGKRRFPRRRQNYRASLCTGLDNLWLMFQTNNLTSIDSSAWMITNESPDGYAVMHVSGKISHIAVGDITAIRTESGDSWQICIVRWALSENQEHLELGLQILSTRANSAFITLPNEGHEPSRLAALLLPEIPPLRPNPMLVVASGALEAHLDSFVLLVEKENIEIREVRSTHLDEQNSLIDVYSIETDSRTI